MFDNYKKVQQGLVGLTSTVSLLVRIGGIVSLPIVDNQPYDLVVDFDSRLFKVQVKTTQYKRGSDDFIVQIGRIRSNKKINKVFRYNAADFDLLSVVTSDRKLYLIPSAAIAFSRSFTLNPDWNKYLIEDGALVNTEKINTCLGTADIGGSSNLENCHTAKSGDESSNLSRPSLSLYA